MGKTYTKSTSVSCGAGPGETVCQWHKGVYQTYSVENGSKSKCKSGDFIKDGDPFDMWSPVEDNVGNGGGFYCVIGPCRNKGDGYWE